MGIIYPGFIPIGGHEAWPLQAYRDKMRLSLIVDDLVGLTSRNKFRFIIDIDEVF